jgi:hypothetical protein
MDWYRKRTLGSILEQAAVCFGRREALVYGARRWTYEEFTVEANRSIRIVSTLMRKGRYRRAYLGVAGGPQPLPSKRAVEPAVPASENDRYAAFSPTAPRCGCRGHRSPCA